MDCPALLDDGPFGKLDWAREGGTGQPYAGQLADRATAAPPERWLGAPGRPQSVFRNLAWGALGRPHAECSRSRGLPGAGEAGPQSALLFRQV